MTRASGGVRLTAACPPPGRDGGGLVCDEAVEQPGAAGALQSFLTATSRAVRGVPRHHMAADLEAQVIVVPHNRRALVAALCPVSAHRVPARRRIHSLWV